MRISRKPALGLLFLLSLFVIAGVSGVSASSEVDPVETTQVATNTAQAPTTTPYVKPTYVPTPTPLDEVKPPDWLTSGSPKRPGCVVPTGSGVEEFSRKVKSLTGFFLSAIAIVFFANVMMNVAEAQFALTTGEHIGYARTIQQAMWAVLLLTIAAGSQALVGPITSKGLSLMCDLSSNDVAVAQAATLNVWSFIARLVISVVLGGVSTMLVIGFTSSGMGAIFSNAVGSPGAMATQIMRFISLGVGTVVTFSSLGLVNLIIKTVFE